MFFYCKSDSFFCIFSMNRAQARFRLCGLACIVLFSSEHSWPLKSLMFSVQPQSCSSCDVNWVGPISNPPAYFLLFFAVHKQRWKFYFFPARCSGSITISHTDRHYLIYSNDFKSHTVSLSWEVALFQCLPLLRARLQWMPALSRWSHPPIQTY